MITHEQLAALRYFVFTHPCVTNYPGEASAAMKAIYELAAQQNNPPKPKLRPPVTYNAALNPKPAGADACSARGSNIDPDFEAQIKGLDW